MNTRKIVFVFRKPSRGNVSIEKVYLTISKTLRNSEISNYSISNYILSYTYDIWSFFKHFLNSIISRNKIIHITGACHYMVLAFPFQKRILTIHDAYFFKNHKGIKGFLYDLFYFYLPIHFSHKIVTVSNHVKLELLDSFKISNTKIEVISNPILIPEEKRKTRDRFFNKDKVIQVLQIGDKPIKNYKRLIEATKNMNVTYCFIHSNTDSINELISNSDLENRAKVFSNISDDSLYTLYNESDVLFFASEAEGFGLPILEAQAFALPIITSNIPPMNSIIEDVILVNPFSVESIKKGFLKLYEFESSMDKSINIPKENTLNNVCEMYLELYKNM